jgi:hypothetical protein
LEVAVDDPAGLVPVLLGLHGDRRPAVADVDEERLGGGPRLLALVDHRAPGRRIAAAAAEPVRQVDDRPVEHREHHSTGPDDGERPQDLPAAVG